VDLPASLASLLVIPALREFFARYRQIGLDIGTGDRFVDLVGEGVDCVLRVGELADSDMVGRRVGRFELATVASAAYLRRHPVPDSLAALQDGHVAVNWISPTTRRAEPLEFMVGRRRREVTLPGCVSVSSAEAYYGCCEAGLGIAQIPRYRIAAALKSGRLRELLPEHPPPSLPMTVLYPQQRQMPARLRVFVDWLVELTATLR
jgi:DNA-binding transcriptional LysR family regulator